MEVRRAVSLCDSDAPEMRETVRRVRGPSHLGAIKTSDWFSRCSRDATGFKIRVSIKVDELNVSTRKLMRDATRFLRKSSKTGDAELTAPITCLAHK